MTDEALDIADRVMFNENQGMRPKGIPKNAIIVTDGPCTCSDKYVQPFKEKLEKRNIRMIVVGIGFDGTTIEKFKEHLRILANVAEGGVYLAKEIVDLGSWLKKYSCKGILG